MAQGTIDRDIPCRGCGYDLRGLNAGGRCPECGGDIGESLSNWLSGIDPRKSRLLTSGASLAVLCAALRIPVAIFWLMLLTGLVVLPDLFHTYIVPELMWDPWMYGAYLALDCIAFIFLGTLRHRDILFALPGLAIAGFLFCFQVKPGRLWLVDLPYFAIVENIFFAAVAFFWCRDAHGIAKRAGEKKLAAGFSILGVLIPIATLMFIAGLESLTEYIGSTSIYTNGGISETAANVLMILPNVILLVAMPFMCIGLLNLHARLKQTIRLAAVLSEISR